MAETKNATKTVSEVIDGNVKYVAKTPTANLAAFAKFVRESDAAPTMKTKAERDAFELGIRLAGLRSRFQDDRRANRIDATETFVEYAIRSTGVETKTENERAALVAGISCYSLYRKYQDSKKVPASA